MAEKVTKKKRDFTKVKLIAQVSLFWLILAGVIMLVQSVDKNSYVRGVNDGVTKTIQTLNVKN